MCFLPTGFAGLISPYISHGPMMFLTPHDRTSAIYGNQRVRIAGAIMCYHHIFLPLRQPKQYGPCAISVTWQFLDVIFTTYSDGLNSVSKNMDHFR